MANKRVQATLCSAPDPRRYHPPVVAFQVYITKCIIENFEYGDLQGFLP
jgi:hypothetical protein